jgi:mannose-6-phosphate isomerase-like protein (cupin superfamily)
MNTHEVALTKGEGRSIWLLGDLYTFKLTSEALSITELTAFPQNGPPPHIHQREDESFWVLDGEFSVLLGERTLTTGQGAFVHFPKGCCTLTRIPAEIALAPTYHLQIPPPPR